MKVYNSLFFIIVLFCFAGCKTTDQALQEKHKDIDVEVSERDELKSSALLIEASKEKMLENWLNAATLYSEALKHNPRNDAAAYELARIYAGSDQLDYAFQYAKQATKIDPDNKHYNLLLADIHLAKGQVDEAIEVQKLIVEKHPEDISLYFNLLKTYMFIDDYDKVTNVLDDIETQIGFSEDLSIEKTQLFLEIGKHDKAIEEAKKLISYYPDEVIYLEFLAEIYTKADKRDKAIEVYHEILEKDPDNAVARLQLADNYKREGKLEKSFEELKKVFKNPRLEKESKGRIMYAFYMVSEENPEYLDQAFKLMDILIEMYPEDAEMYAMYGDFLFRENEKEQARDMFLKSATINPDQYSVWEQMIYISSQLEDYEFIVKYSEKAIEYFFEQPVLYFFNGIANYQLENYEEAIDSFTFGVDFVVDNKDLKGQFYTLMGDTYNNLDEHEKSDKYYEKALELDPENTFALNNYSYFLATRNENLEYAREMSAKANKLEQKNSAYLDTYGWILYKMGKYEESEKWIKKAIENSGEDNATILEHYGDVLFKLNKKDEALKYWEKAKQAGNGSEYLEKKLRDKKLYE